MRWRPDDIAFDIVDDETDDPVVTVRFETPPAAFSPWRRSRNAAVHCD